MELMTPHVGTIFWTALTFIVLLLLLRKYGWSPILSMLDERELRIKESLQAADLARKEAQKGNEERQKVMEAARREAQDILLAVRQTAEKSREEIMKKAQDDAGALLDRAKREIETSRDDALKEIRKLAVELSMAATEKLIGKSLSAEEHQKLISDSLQKMERLN